MADETVKDDAGESTGPVLDENGYGDHQVPGTSNNELDDNGYPAHQVPATASDEEAVDPATFQVATAEAEPTPEVVSEAKIPQERVTSSTLLIEVESQAYPVSLADIFAKHNQCSFPQEPLLYDIKNLGYAVVESSPMPEGDVITEGKPVLDDGVWKRTWNTRQWDEKEAGEALGQHKLHADEKVMAVRNDDFEMGMEYEVEGSGSFHVQLRVEDKPNLLLVNSLGVAAVAAGDEKTINFRSYENTTVALTPQQAVEMTAAALVAIMKIYQASWDLKDQIKAAQTLDELPQVPATFL